MMKSGWKTTEFWITVGLGIVGTLLASNPATATVGAMILTAAGIAYPVSRGIAKK